MLRLQPNLNFRNLLVNGKRPLFRRSFFCSHDQSCKTLQTMQVAPTQNKEAVGSAFHFEQNKPSRKLVPGRDLYMKRLVIILAEKANFFP